MEAGLSNDDAVVAPAHHLGSFREKNGPLDDVDVSRKSKRRRTFHVRCVLLASAQVGWASTWPASFVMINHVYIVSIADHSLQCCWYVHNNVDMESIA